MVFRHAGTAGEDCSDHRRLIKSDNFFEMVDGNRGQFFDLVVLSG